MEQTPTPTTAAESVVAPPMPVGDETADFDQWIESRGTETPETPAREPAEPEPEPVAETPAVVAAGEPVEEPEPDQASEAGRTLAKHKSSLQDRINQATAKQREAERRADALAAELATAKAGATPAARPATITPAIAPAGYVTPADDPEPTQEDFQDQDDPYMAHAKAASRWAARDENRKIQYTQTQQFAEARARIDAEAAARQTEQVVAAHSARFDTFRTTHPDFDARLASSTAVTTPVMGEEIAHADRGPEIVNYLLDNPAESVRIAALSERAQRFEMGKLAARFEVAPATGPARTAPPLSQALPPPKPVGASATTLARDPASITDTDEYIDRMNAEEKRRRRG